MSYPTGGFTGQLSPSAVQTAIDGVMYERYDREMQPEYLSARDTMFFKQGSLDLLSFIWEEQSNVGEFDKTSEQEPILASDVWIGNQKTKSSQKFTKKIPISDEAFRADKVDMRTNIGMQIGDRARLTQDKTAILETYADAFAGSENTTPDGQALASNSHTTLTGTTVDNLETGSLTPDNLWTLVTSLAGQYAQDGAAGSHLFRGMLVPFNLYMTAKEVLDSELAANTAENQLNVFNTDYGEVQVRASIFLTSTYNSATNAATSYHIISDNHMICRKVFYDLVTEMIEPKYSGNDTWQLQQKFHETVFPGSWTGYAASNGST